MRSGLRHIQMHTIIASFSLALAAAGVGVVFSITAALVFSPIPYKDVERIVIIKPTPSWELFQRWRAQTHVVAESAAYNERAANVSGTAMPQRVLIGRVTVEFLSLIGVRPARGRGFDETDYEPGNTDVALITEAFWRRHFTSSSDVVGRTLALDDRAFIIVGVLPAAFRPPTDLIFGQELSIERGASIFIPLSRDPRLVEPNSTDRAWRGISVLSRLQPGVTLQEGRTLLEMLMNTEPMREHGQRRLTLVDLPTYVSADIGKQLAVLNIAVGLLLMISCANVANVLVARALSRTHEFGVRVALGASKGHLVACVLKEVLPLSLGGGVVGVALAWVGIRVVRAWGAEVLSGIASATVDWRTVLVGISVSVLAGVVAGTLPAMRVSSVDPLPTLRLGHGNSQRSRSVSLRSTLVTFQVALLLALLVSTGLLTTSLARLLRLDLGFRAAGLLAADISLSRVRYASRAEAATFFRQLLDDAVTLPGVQAAAVGSNVPGGPGLTVADVTPERLDSENPATAPRANSAAACEIIAGDYFRALSIPLYAGRVFDQTDTANGQPVAIVSESFARQHWGKPRDAVGKRLFLGERAHTVVGVTGDIRSRFSASLPLVYFAYEQFPIRTSQMTLFLRGAGNPTHLTKPLMRMIHETDPSQPIYNVVPVERIVTVPLGRLRLTTGMVSVFAGLTMLIAGMGIWGAVSRAVSEQLPEIAVRSAFGCPPVRLFGVVLRQGFWPVIAGVMVGLPLAFAFTSFLRSQIEGVDAGSVGLYSVTVLLVVVVASVACGLPALSAMRTDPVAILQQRRFAPRV